MNGDADAEAGAKAIREGGGRRREALGKGVRE
jgi:hypothetical protein